MGKIAVFVEGQTEQIFIEKLLIEIAGEKRLATEVIHFSGGSKATQRARQVVVKLTATSDTKHILSIFNCQTDNRVASDVRDNYESLVKNGYTAIIAVRDIYPLTSADIPNLRRMLGYGIKTKPITPLFVLGVMETEAWFISEHTHFLKISTNLDCTAIKNIIGMSPDTDDMQQLANPSSDLNKIYRSTGRSYDKSKAVVQATTNLLDYSVIYNSFGTRFVDLKNLFELFDAFLTS